MTATLSHITVAQVLAVLAVIFAVGKFGGRVWAWAVRAVHFVDKLESIEKQVYANGGSSMRDAVDRIAETQGVLAKAHVETTDRLDSVVSELGELRGVLEQHITDSTRQPRRNDDPPEADFRPVTH